MNSQPLSPAQRAARRMNRTAVRARLVRRDGGMKCHYCSVQLVPAPAWDAIRSGVSPETKKLRTYAAAIQRGARLATIDHIVPVRDGGTKDLRNLVLACRQCNRERGCGDYAAFLQLKRNESFAPKEVAMN